MRFMVFDQIKYTIRFMDEIMGTYAYCDLFIKNDSHASSYIYEQSDPSCQLYGIKDNILFIVYLCVWYLKHIQLKLKLFNLS